MGNVADLEAQLNAFDPAARRAALDELAAAGIEPAPPSDNVNMHIHTFFSYNAEGWSPSRAAWESRKRGLYAAGIIDFDVLDGMDEFHHAGERLCLRVNVGVETRVYYAEYADKELDSPGEPGVHYLDGIGFTRAFPPESPQARTLARYRRNAQERNRALVERINPHVPDIAIDYDRDVLPLTPTGSATERHIVAAYVNRSLAVIPRARLAAYWANLLRLRPAETDALLADRPAFEDKVRARLVKRGGLGYEQPTVRTFPPMDEFFAWVKACGAIPMESWLDGTSSGERDARALMECSLAKGARAFSIIPERNWHIADADERAVKLAALERVVTLADAMHLPINIGTEMNKRGLPFVDDLGGPVLKRYKDTFRRGAQVAVGHALLARFADFPYAGDAADAEFADAAAKNDFFAAVGALPPLTAAAADALRAVAPAKALARFRDRVRKQ